MSDVRQRLKTDLAAIRTAIAAGRLEEAKRMIAAVPLNAPPSSELSREIGGLYLDLGFPVMAGRYWYLLEDKSDQMIAACDEFLADYDPAEDADLYETFLADEGHSSPPKFHKIWIEQCEAAQGIEDEFGTQKALEYIVGEKFLNFLEAAESNPDFRAEISAFVAKIKEIFEPWQLAQYLETARETEPFDPGLFEPRSHPELGEEEIEFDAEEIEDMRKDDIRQCTRDLLLVERAREWLLTADAE